MGNGSTKQQHSPSPSESDCEGPLRPGMDDVSSFWRNSQFHDATLLLGSDRSLLEQRRVTLQAALNLSTYKCEICKKDQKEHIPATDPDPCKVHSADRIPVPCFQLTKRGTVSPKTLLNVAGNSDAVAYAATNPSQVLTIPVHRIVLSTGSLYFKTAITTLIGDRASPSDDCLQHPLHPIIVIFEEDVEAAQEVLHCLYTKTVDSSYSTGPQLMQILLVSGMGCSLYRMHTQSATYLDIKRINCHVECSFERILQMTQAGCLPGYWNCNRTHSLADPWVLRYYHNDGLQFNSTPKVSAISQGFTPLINTSHDINFHCCLHRILP